MKTNSRWKKVVAAGVVLMLWIVIAGWSFAVCLDGFNRSDPFEALVGAVCCAIATVFAMGLFFEIT